MTVTCAYGRARRGASGALYPQSALAGLNSPSRPGSLGLAPSSGVDDRVPHGENPRTPPGSEGSNGKWASSGVVGQPDRSWLADAKLESRGRRGVHGLATGVGLKPIPVFCPRHHTATEQPDAAAPVPPGLVEASHTRRHPRTSHPSGGTLAHLLVPHSSPYMLVVNVRTYCGGAGCAHWSHHRLCLPLPSLLGGKQAASGKAAHQRP